MTPLVATFAIAISASLAWAWPHNPVAVPVAGPAPEAEGRKGSDPIIYSDSPSFVIPFTRTGNLILIQAKADTTNGYYVLDTGAPGLVLNLTYFRHYLTTLQKAAG